MYSPGTPMRIHGFPVRNMMYTQWIVHIYDLYIRIYMRTQNWGHPMHNCVMIKLTWVLLFWSVILHHSFMFISKPLLVILGLVYCSTVRKHTNSVLGKASCDVHEITKTTHFICLGQIGSHEGSTASISFGFHYPLTWIP